MNNNFKLKLINGNYKRNKSDFTNTNKIIIHPNFNETLKDLRQKSNYLK